MVSYKLSKTFQADSEDAAVEEFHDHASHEFPEGDISVSSVSTPHEGADTYNVIGDVEVEDAWLLTVVHDEVGSSTGAVKQQLGSTLDIHSVAFQESSVRVAASVPVVASDGEELGPDNSETLFAVNKAAADAVHDEAKSELRSPPKIEDIHPSPSHPNRFVGEVNTRYYDGHEVLQRAAQDVAMDYPFSEDWDIAARQ